MSCQSFPRLAGLTGGRKAFINLDNMGRAVFRHVIGNTSSSCPGRIAEDGRGYPAHVTGKAPPCFHSKALICSASLKSTRKESA